MPCMLSGAIVVPGEMVEPGRVLVIYIIPPSLMQRDKQHKKTHSSNTTAAQRHVLNRSTTVCKYSPD